MKALPKTLVKINPQYVLWMLLMFFSSILQQRGPKGDEVQQTKTLYCMNESLIWSCSVSINNCRSESVQLLQEATLRSDQWSNSSAGWSSTCIKDQLK